MGIGLRAGFQVQIVVALFILGGASSYSYGDEPAGDTRYFSNLLDHRSRYGQGWFPEPFLAPEMDVDREIRLDWLHAEQPGTRIDELNFEVEYNFDLLTIEVEVPYETTQAAGEGSHGIGNVE